MAGPLEITYMHPAAPGCRMSRVAGWIGTHHLVSFFALTYAVSWSLNGAVIALGWSRRGSDLPSGHVSGLGQGDDPATNEP